MTIMDIKTKLNVVSLDLERCLDKDGKRTEWLRFWDNDNRIAVVMHEDVRDKIKENPKRVDLKLKSSERTAMDSGKDYMNHIVFIINEVETSF